MVDSPKEKVSLMVLRYFLKVYLALSVGRYIKVPSFLSRFNKPICSQMSIKNPTSINEGRELTWIENTASLEYVGLASLKKDSFIHGD